MLNNQDFGIQLFASLVPHKSAEFARDLHRLATAEITRHPHRGELLDPGIPTVKERSRQKSSWVYNSNTRARRSASRCQSASKT
ncbi:hypothetical protein GQ600_3898 [Phytophthora cactorum]|nr:hypothetical protein GQ600_3898 [Phytophthora cactorum]